MTGKRTLYRFGDIEVDPAAQRVARAGAELSLEPKAYAVLVALLEDAGRALGRDELLDRVWGHRHVTPGVLNRVIAQLRKALGDDAEHPRYIQTLHSRGYRFIPEVECVLPAEPVPPAMLAPATAIANGAPAPAGPAASAPAGAQVPQAHASHDAGAGHADRHPADSGHAVGHHSSEAVFRRWRWIAALATLAMLALLAWNRDHPVAAPAQASVAVLPFTSLSSDANDRYFAEGLAIEMHDALAGVEGLQVAALLSPDARGAWRDAKAVGERLGVATVLDASVRRDGPRLRISAHLSDTRTGYVLWSHVYERQAGDIFATQGEIAREVVHALLGRSPGADGALARRMAPTTSVAAFDAYLLGLQALWRADGTGSLDRADQAFGQALAADAGFALAQAGVCRVEVVRFVQQRDPDAYARAGSACARAQQMDPGSSEVALALAELHEAHGDNAAAVADYARAELDPARRPAVYVGMAMLRADEGRGDLARGYFARALALRPRDPAIHSWYGYHRYLSGDFPGAVASYREAVALAPGNPLYWNMLGVAHGRAGDDPAAAQAYQRSIAIEPGPPALGNLGELRYRSGDYAAAAALQQRAVALAPDDYLLWANLGDALLAVPGRADDATRAFRNAATHARRYLATRPDDAVTVATLAWSEANLGDADAARALARRAETLPAQRALAGEVAFYNAQTYALLGEPLEARARVAAALAAGVSQTRVDSNVILRRARITTAREPSQPPPATQAPGARQEP